MIYIDTLKHHDALIERLLASDDWTSTRLSICKEFDIPGSGEKRYITLAPRFMPQQELDEEIRIHRRDHTMDIFAREAQSKPSATEDATFRDEMFRHYSERDPEFIAFASAGLGTNVLIMDPARTAKPHNAQTAFVVWLLDPWGRRMFLRYAKGEYLYPDQMYKRAFELALFYNCEVVAYEETGLKEFIKQPIEQVFTEQSELQLQDRRSTYRTPLLIPVNPRRMAESDEGQKILRGKAMRVAHGLLKFYREGIVYHEESLRKTEDPTNQTYEDYLLAFPRPKLWDLPDAASYIGQLIAIGEIYFPPITVGESVRREGMRRGAESPDAFYDMVKIDVNQPIGSTWRVI